MEQLFPAAPSPAFTPRYVRVRSPNQLNYKLFRFLPKSLLGQIGTCLQHSARTCTYFRRSPRSGLSRGYGSSRVVGESGTSGVAAPSAQGAEGSDGSLVLRNAVESLPRGRNGAPRLRDDVAPRLFRTSVSFTSSRDVPLRDPEPLFGAPPGAGPTPVLPAELTATASGANEAIPPAPAPVLMTATGPGATIDIIMIDEFGDATLTGPAGPGNWRLREHGGFMTVLEDINGPLARPVVIGFNAGGLQNGASHRATWVRPARASRQRGSTSGAAASRSMSPRRCRTRPGMLSSTRPVRLPELAGNNARSRRRRRRPACVITVIPSPEPSPAVLGLFGCRFERATALAVRRAYQGTTTELKDRAPKAKAAPP